MTCGVSVNHLTLNENDIGPYRTFFRLRPPLRSEDDRAAMVRGIAAGDIDVIVSSHDPQDADVKRHPFAEAADGAIGLETLLAAALRLHHSGEVGLIPAAQGHDHQSGQAAGAASGRLAKGAPADLILVDLGQPWVVDKVAAQSALEELARSTRARCKAACSTPWLPATPPTNTLARTAADAIAQPEHRANGR